MADLFTWAAIAEIVGAATVLGALWFAMAQLRAYRRAREESAAIELVRSIMTPDFSHNLAQIYDLAPGMSADEIRAGGAQRVDALMRVLVPLESLGVLVYKRILDLATLDLLVGGFVRELWSKARGFVEDQRSRTSSPNFGEWVQWLAERLDQYPVHGKAAGAHVSFADWNPRGAGGGARRGFRGR